LPEVGSWLVQMEEDERELEDGEAGATGTPGSTGT
jgi:hypothetical protein